MKLSRYAWLLMIFVGMSGCFSVLFGAWLAHGGQVLAEPVQNRLASALQYQFIHTIALLFSLVLYRLSSHVFSLYAALFFTFGIIFFSGSLYLKTLFAVPLFGKVAPLGGLCFAFAWLLIGFIGKSLFENLGNSSK